MMNQGQLAGYLLVIGFVSIIIASVVGPPRLYQEPDIDRQLEMIADHSASWVASNLFFGLAGLVRKLQSQLL